MFPLSLAQRRFRPEIMDQPGLDEARHHHALSGLSRLNRASNITRQLWKPIRSYSKMHGTRALRVLDVASGGGDVPLGLWKLAQKNGITLRILGLDASPTACRYATQQCSPAGGSISFRQTDVTRDELPMGFDIVICSLFLHHLSFAHGAELLKRMGAAGRLLVVSDLRRCAVGYALAQLACHLLTTSQIVGSDGPQSVVNAFSLSEFRELCRAADLKGASIRAVWPFRLLLVR
ncbi:MAG: methyltransferase domain-containing protein [Pirellulales bacterium]